MSTKSQLFYSFVSTTVLLTILAVILFFFSGGGCPSFNSIIVSIVFCFIGAIPVRYLIFTFSLHAELLNSLGEKCFQLRKNYVLNVRLQVNYVQPIFNRCNKPNLI